MVIISNNYYCKELDEIYNELQTNPEIGLRMDDIPEKLEKYGANKLPKIKRSIWRIYFAPIFNLLIVLLILIAIPLVFVGGLMDVMITFGVIIANATASIIQQFRAQKTLKSLMKLTALKATVIRNGIPAVIDTTELVPGDIIDLKQGDKIPADSRIISSSNLEVNEAALTGESAAVPKSNEIITEKALAIQKQTNVIFQGTFVTMGKARAIVVHTGGSTEIGKLSAELNEGGVAEIPLTRKMNNMAKYLAIGVVIMISIALIYKFMLYYSLVSPPPFDQAVRDIIKNSISAGKNLVPINLPLLTTLVLVTGVFNLAKTGVIIRNLTAIEALGRVSVIASDKTGTITKNEMTVKFIWFDNKNLLVPDVEYPNTTPVYYNQDIYDFSTDPYFDLFIKSQVINNNAELTIDLKKITVKGKKEKQIRRIIGAPTEGALLILAQNIGYNIEEIRQEFEILKEFPFDSSVKRMSTIVREPNNESYAFVKGASEILIDQCSNIVLDGQVQPLKKKIREKILEDIDVAAKAGLRTLSIAYKPVNDGESLELKREEVENDLTFLGFVSILDPPREGVRESVHSCHEAGVSVVMVTGDHPVTAQAIAMEVGIFKPGARVVEGSKIDNLSDEEFRETAVFARVSPQDKVKIVKRYQDEQNKLVAMTGDGVNDAIALKQAHTGIAMGITGSDVAKEAADMIISDDNFNSIERGLQVGRGIFHRIRVIIFFFISLNLMEAVIFLSFQFFPDFQFAMFTFFQFTYIYITAHTFPALALIVDKFPRDIMKEPPRNSEEIFTIPLIKLMILQGIFMGLGIVIAYLIPMWGLAPFDAVNGMGYTPPLTPDQGIIFGLAQAKGRTMAMTVIFLAETIIIWSIRRPNSSIKDSFFKEFNKWLLIMIVFVWFLHFGAMYFGADVNPVLQNALGENYYLGWVFLNGWDWLWVIGLASMGIVAVELYKWHARRNHRYF